MQDRTPEKLYYSIGEVSRLSEVQPHILRFWEEKFPILHPKKNKAGNRIYRLRDVKIVLMLKELLQKEGYEEVQKKLKDKEFLNKEIQIPTERVKLKYLVSEIKEDLKKLLEMVDEL